jgi:hypothetical protein
MPNVFKLTLKFIKARQRLAEMVEKYGPLDPRVLKHSKEVDKLAARLQREKVAG